ncbi:hypothetical protein ACS0TY_013751 [Phlomoides rotata]
MVRPVNEGGFPRFLKWDLNDLKKQLCRFKVTSLDSSYVMVKLKMTPREQQQFQVLLSFWEKEKNGSSLSTEMDGYQDTFVGNSQDNDTSYARPEPSQSNYETDDDFDATIELGTRNTSMDGDHLNLKEPTTSKSMSIRKRLDKGVVRILEICDSTNVMLTTDDMPSFKFKKSRSSISRPTSDSVTTPSWKVGHESNQVIDNNGNDGTDLT